MKKFVFSLVSVIALCLGVFILLHVIHALREQNRFVLPEGKTIVALSNSHTQCALDDQGWPEFVNLSSGGTLPWVWFLKLKTIIDRSSTHSIEAIILSFGVYETIRRDNPSSDIELFSRYFPMPFFQDCYPHSKIDAVLTLKFVDTIFSFDGITAKWSDPPPPDSSNDFDAGKTIRQHFGDLTQTNIVANKVFLQSLTSMINYAMSKNIEVILLSTPYFEDYRDAVPQDVIDSRNRIIKTLTKRYSNVTHLDYYAAETMTRRDFLDANHLSSTGREKLTPLVKSEIERILKEKKDSCHPPNQSPDL